MSVRYFALIIGMFIVFSSLALIYLVQKQDNLTDKNYFYGIAALNTILGLIILSFSFDNVSQEIIKEKIVPKNPHVNRIKLKRIEKEEEESSSDEDEKNVITIDV